MHMETTPSTKLSVLTRCILVACLMQSSYAEVCYIRSHRGYGGCIRWFLQAEKVLNCTSIKLGGYTTALYRRSQIIELDQPFVSDIAEDVQDFLENQVPSLATTYVKKMAEDSTSYVTTWEGTSDQVPTSTVSMSKPIASVATSHVKTAAANSMKYTTTEEATNDEILTYTLTKSTTAATKLQKARTQNGGKDVAKSTQKPTQSSTDRVFFSTTECPDLVCPANMTSRELTLKEIDDDLMDNNNDSSQEILRQCGSNKVLVCGCEKEINSFFPIGLTYNAHKVCRCYRNGSLTCYHNTNVGNTVCENFDDDEERILFTSNGDNGDASIIHRPTGCHDFYKLGFRRNGIYCIYPRRWNRSSLMVYCHMGDWPQDGWTVIQRRVNGSHDFHRNWTEYKNGFGDLNHEFWMGNENIYRLTNQIDMKLRIDITINNEKLFAVYHLFRIGGEDTSYQLTKLGDITNTKAYYTFQAHVNTSFSTHDRDTKMNGSTNCANITHGGWWFTDCHTCNFNAVYEEFNVSGILWHKLKGCEYNITSTEMKIRLAE